LVLTTAEETLTIRPLPAPIIAPAKAWHIRNVPSRLIAITLRQSS
jgi:hypothetical protein